MKRTIFNGFMGRLTKFKAKVTENNVSQLFSLEFRSIYDNQNFLTDLIECRLDVDLYFREQVFWDQMVISVNADVCIEFDELPPVYAKLLSIKVKKRYSAKDMSDVYTYEMFFEKDVDKDVDALMVHYMNATDEDENGSKHLIDFPIDMKYIPPIQTNLLDE